MGAIGYKVLYLFVSHDQRPRPSPARHGTQYREWGGGGMFEANRGGMKRMQSAATHLPTAPERTIKVTCCSRAGAEQARKQKQAAEANL